MSAFVNFVICSYVWKEDRSCTDIGTAHNMNRKSSLKTIMEAKISQVCIWGVLSERDLRRKCFLCCFAFAMRLAL